MVASATNCCCIFSRRLRSAMTCSCVFQCVRLRLSGGICCTASTQASGQSPPEEKSSVLGGCPPKERMRLLDDDDGCPGSFLTGPNNGSGRGNAGTPNPGKLELW